MAVKYNERKILIAGASGLLGSELYYFLKDYYNILPIALNLYNDSNIKSVDITNFDYKLSPSSIAINAGSDPDSVGNYYLTPQYEYLHPANLTPRIISGSLVDVGAFEYIFPVNTNNFTTFKNYKKLLKIIDILGRKTKETNQPLFYIYDDGTVEKKIIIE